MNSQQNSNVDNSSKLSYQKKLVKYLFLCIISEGSKILLFSLFFLLIGWFREFVVALLALMVLRTNGGGIHFNRYTGCLIFSFLVLLSSILLAFYLPVSMWIKIPTTLLCAPIGYFLVPIQSAKRPAATDSLIRKSKRHTLFFISLIFIVICIAPQNTYTQIIFWTLILHIAQLWAAKINVERRKKVCSC